jgi:hypothetical protein
LPEKTDKLGEKSIDLSGTEFLRSSQLMKTYEVANPVELSSTDSVVMQTHHCPDLFMQTRFGDALHS